MDMSKFKKSKKLLAKKICRNIPKYSLWSYSKKCLCFSLLKWDYFPLLQTEKPI